MPTYETGHPIILESFGKMIAAGGLLNQTRLNPPLDLTIEKLILVQTDASARQNNVGDKRADFRTIALTRAQKIAPFDTYASQAVDQLEGRGASAETAEDGRGYVRKLQGRRKSPKPVDDPSTPDIDESESGISASHQSSAAQLSTMYEFVDFLEAQPEYAGVTKAGLTIPELRAMVDEASAAHDLSINAAAQLSTARAERNKLFYLDANNILDLAKRYKKLVRGEYGATSPEYKNINAIPFKKPKL